MTDAKKDKPAPDPASSSTPVPFYPGLVNADPPKGPPVGFQGETLEEVSGTLTGTISGNKIEGTFQPDAKGKGVASGPAPKTYNGKTLDELSDVEALALANGFGPSIISQELYDRAQEIQKKNPGGVYGPAILDPNHFPSSAPPAEAPAGAESPAHLPANPATASDDPWHSFSQKDLVKIAQQENVSHKGKASRDDIIAALEGAGVQPPPIAEFEAYHGPRGTS
jgi:hypothetical protein